MSLTDTEIDDRIGARVRELRVARGLTLDELARLGRISRAMLSRIERGESSPTAQLLVKLCGGLGITPSVLFAATEAATGPLARRAAQPVWRDPATGYIRRNVSPSGTGSPVDIVEVEIPAGGSVALDSLPLEGWDQHVWVLDGALELGLGPDGLRLERGDCLRMRFDQPIRFANPTERPVRYAVVVGRGGSRS